jgi:hypothetical protein
MLFVREGRNKSHLFNPNESLYLKETNSAGFKIDNEDINIKNLISDIDPKNNKEVALSPMPRISTITSVIAGEEEVGVSGSPNSIRNIRSREQHSPMKKRY